MKRWVTALGLSLSALLSLSAQTPEPAVRLRLTLGLCYAAYREETYSTILQRLDAARLDVDLDFGGAALLHRVSAGFTLGRTTSSVSDTSTIARYYDEYSGEPVVTARTSPITAVKARMSWGLAAPVASLGVYQGNLGAILRMDALIQIANYPSISFVAALGPLYRQRFTLSLLDRVAVDLWAPVLAYAVRPPYAGADAALMQMAASNPLAIFGTGRLLSLGRHHGIALDAVYTHAVTPNLDLVYGLSAELMRTAVPLPRADAELDLRAGAAVGP